MNVADKRSLWIACEGLTEVLVTAYARCLREPFKCKVQGPRLGVLTASQASYAAWR